MVLSSSLYGNVKLTYVKSLVWFFVVCVIVFRMSCTEVFMCIEDQVFVQRYRITN